MNATTPRRLAYISAGSRGIGLAVARRLANGGMDIVLSSRSRENLERAEIQIREANPSVCVQSIVADIASRDKLDMVFGTFEATGRWPDVFVCNSGQPKEVTLTDLKRDQWDHDVELLLGHGVFSCQRLVPEMAARGFGRVIFISSTYVKAPTQHFLSSSVCRAGLLVLSKAIVDQYASAGVATFVLSLGFVDTPLLRNMALARDFDAPDPANDSPTTALWQAKYDEWASLIPAGKIGNSDDLAELVAFLASPSAAYLNGSVLSFAGGLDKTIL